MTAKKLPASWTITLTADNNIRIRGKNRKVFNFDEVLGLMAKVLLTELIVFGSLLLLVIIVVMLSELFPNQKVRRFFEKILGFLRELRYG